MIRTYFSCCGSARLFRENLIEPIYDRDALVTMYIFVTTLIFIVFLFSKLGLISSVFVACIVICRQFVTRNSVNKSIKPVFRKRGKLEDNGI